MLYYLYNYYMYMVTMYIQSNIKKVGTKTYRSVLLVQNYREESKVKHRVLANLTALPSLTSP